MRNLTRVPRYYQFRLTFQPTTDAVTTLNMVTGEAAVRAYGWKDALNQADREFGLDRVRFITHPSNDGVAAAYMDVDNTEVLVGQVTATKA